MSKVISSVVRHSAMAHQIKPSLEQFSTISQPIDQIKRLVVTSNGLPDAKLSRHRNYRVTDKFDEST